MKRLLVFIVVTAALVTPALARSDAQTPALPTADQIVEKFVAAAGGRAAIEKITSIQGKGSIQVPDAGLTGTIELFQKAPDKSLTIVDLPGVGTQREGFDGTTAWSEDPQNGLRIKTGLEAAEAKRSATFSRELKLKFLYPTLNVKGREAVGGRDAYVVEGVPTEGSPAKMFFDVESGLLVRNIITRQTPMGPLEVDVSLEDYRAVDGVKRPFTIRQVTSMFTATIQFSEVKHNVAIDDAMFKKPGGASRGRRGSPITSVHLLVVLSRA